MKKLLSIILGLFLVSAFVVNVNAKKPDSPPGQDKTNACATIKDGTIEYGRVTDPSTEIIPIGYDMWGYNYQAHMFNGYYENYSRPDTLVSEGSMLQMKWSDEWLSNKDCNGDGKLDRGYSCNPENPTSSGCPGAWLTNHERGSYLSEWNMVGSWEHVGYYGGSSYHHEWVVTSQDGNTFSGEGKYPSGGPTYTIFWTMTGELDGDNVEMHIDYSESSYYADLSGSIESDGTIEGTWTDSNGKSGNWETMLGAATRDTCDYNYFVKIITPDTNADAEEGVWYSEDGVEIGEQIWGAYAIVQEVNNDSCGNSRYKSPYSPGLGFYTPKP